MKNILWKKPKNYQYLFLDMNAYFASVEQQLHPEFRGKPLVVTPTPCPTGCIVTSSYEARSHGIKTGMQIREAQFLYPKIIIRSSDTLSYLAYHKKLIHIIGNITPFYHIKSIDELAIKLSPIDQNIENATSLAINIKNVIRRELGLYVRCSIGISSNIFLAKMAAESKKPDGLTILKKENVRYFLSHSKLTDLCGISYRMEKKLKILNINNPVDFYNSDIQTLKSKLGKVGEYWYLNLHGYDKDNIFLSRCTKTLSQSHVLEPKFRSWPAAWSVCEKLIFKAARRLRESFLTPKKIFLKINFLDHKKYKTYINISPVNDSFTLTKHFKSLFASVPKNSHFPLKLTIVFSNFLKSNPYQQNIFSDFKKELLLSASIDKINNRFSPNTIYPANLLLTKNSAPDRISFGQPKF